MAATILIVEDEFAVARGIQFALQQEGYEVVVARSGEEGLEFATGQAPDLVVLDVVMPGGTGLKVLEHIRATPTLSPLPVVIFTGHASVAIQEAAARLGANSFYEKPTSFTDLVQLVSVLYKIWSTARRPSL